ncbi:MAG: J domain-containing protein [Myxococcota bacterium]
MGIFDRLSRLARAEANHLGERVREAISGGPTSDRYGTEDGSEDGSQASQPEIEPGPAQARGRSTGAQGDEPAGGRWSREVREAYAALGLPLGATRTEARAAYKRLLHAHHPDKHQDDGEAERRATERTMKIRVAWERLDEFLPKD